jgi:N-acetylglutamate synthase-like GNAT family acetyltransferase
MTRDTRTRMAGTSDRRTLGEMDPRVAGDMHRREMIDAAISARRCWVAERSGRVVGYGVLTKNFFARDFVELLFVAEDARRSGAGSAILAGIERAVQADRLFTSTNESNAAMRALLATRGYIESGRIENLDPGDPELVFVKFLRG